MTRDRLILTSGYVALLAVPLSWLSEPAAVVLLVVCASVVLIAMRTDPRLRPPGGP